MDKSKSAWTAPFLCAGLLLVLPNPAAAWWSGSNSWRIVPVSDVGDLVSVKKKSVISRARLVPLDVVAITTSVPGPPERNPLAQAGTLFIRSSPRGDVIPIDARVYCTASYGPNSPPQPEGVYLYNSSLLCFVDENRDGAFESSYYAYSQASSLMIQSAKPSRVTPINLTPYREVSPETYSSRMHAFVAYAGKSVFGQHAFLFGIGADPQAKNTKVTCLLFTPELSTPLVEGGSVEAFGLLLEVSAIGKDSLSLRIARDFSESDLTVSTSGGGFDALPNSRCPTVEAGL